jgi:outer membrane protein OmpU
MNTLKKIGLSALAGSLVAVSAHAGEMAVTGGLTATYATKSGDSGTQTDDHGRGFSTATDITFTGSGEMDNGWTVSGFVTQLEGMGAVSSSQMTITMGDMGKLKVNRVGGGAVNGMDDKLPSAWEEASDNSAHDFIGEDIGSGIDDGSISYFLPAISLEGATMQIGVDYDPAAGVAAGGTGSTQISTTLGAGMGVSVDVTTDLGLSIYAGAEEHERNVTSATAGYTDSDTFNGTVGAKYAYGPVTVGYQQWYNDAGAGTHYESDGMAVAFAVNENLSLSYAKIDETKYQAGLRSLTNVEASLKAYNVAYSMGSIAIKAHHGKFDNPDFASDTSNEMTEVSVSFAF